jgi:beta-glucuronidase
MKKEEKTRFQNKITEEISFSIYLKTTHSFIIYNMNKPSNATLKIFFYLISIIGIMTYGCQSNKGKPSDSNVEITSSNRKVVELDEWKFQMDIRDIGEKENWYKESYNKKEWAEVSVPQAWNCYEDAMWQYQGIGWYTKVIQPEDFVAGNKVKINFGRVMYYSKLWINGEFIGENIGGYLPFSFDITNHLKPGEENILVLRVDNRSRIEWLPAAEQIEWIQYGGILEPVKLVSKSHIYIDDLTITTIPEADGKDALVTCKVLVANETSEGCEVEVAINISGGSGILDKSIVVNCGPNGQTQASADFYLEGAELWSPDTPNLYSAHVDLLKDSKKIDNFSDRFGVRQVSVDGTSILLNGEPLKIKGTHRYDAYDRYGPNPPEELVKKELELMKKVGINMIRVHYPASPEFLDLLDEYGILMKEELPLNWWGNKYAGMIPIGGRAEQSLDILPQAKSTLAKMISRDKNHPCIIIWSMANECATYNEVGTQVMKELIGLAKSLDSTRLVTFVAGHSPIGHPAFEDADIVCFNDYLICNHINEIDSAVYQRLAKDLVTYRNYFKTKPIVMSEFGRQGIKGLHGDIFYTEEWQAAYIESVWKALSENPTISGGILWTWADYFHETHFALQRYYDFYGVSNASYGPFGVVTSDRKQKKSLETLARMYGGSIPDNGD